MNPLFLLTLPNFILARAAGRLAPPKSGGNKPLFLLLTLSPQRTSGPKDLQGSMVATRFLNGGITSYFGKPIALPPGLGVN